MSNKLFSMIAVGVCTFALALISVMSGLFISLSDPKVQAGTTMPITGTATAVSAGGEHSLAIVDGKLYAWGRNNFGQLGLGDTVNRNAPTRVGTENNWSVIAAGHNHSLAINNAGELYLWGSFIAYMTLPSNVNIVPTLVSFPSGVTGWKSVVAGEHSSLALTTGGEIYKLKENNDITKVPGNNYASIATSGARWFAIDNNGMLWRWGNYYFIPSIGSWVGPIPYHEVPANDITGNNWSSVVAGWGHSLALEKNGRLWSWGWNSAGQLGHGVPAYDQFGMHSHRNFAYQIGTSTGWAKIGAGFQHSFAIDNNGRLWSWGNNEHGQLGLGDTVNKLAPTQIVNTNSWVAVDGGEAFSIAINNKGEIFTWGRNSSGQLGTGDNNDRLTPTHVEIVFSQVAIAAGAEYSLAIIDGELYSWGLNMYGQLGLGDYVTRLSPTRVGVKNDWISIAAGMHSLAINSDGELWAWGWNSAGQLGLGHYTNRNAPTRVGNKSNWKTIAVDNSHSLAINDENELWVWGRNDIGQLGLGSIVNQTEPQKVTSPARNWQAIAAGDRQTLAITTDGELWACGSNNIGQLGIGSTPLSTTTFVRVGDKSNWASVATDSFFAVGINSAGEMYSWGQNSIGELGLGYTSESMRTPQRIGLNSNWTAIAVGSIHTLAINSNGELFSWGRGNGSQLGQLGLGDIVAVNSPTRIGTASNWRLACADWKHSMAVNSKGQIFSWGSNSFGHLGLGDTIPRLIPMPVDFDPDRTANDKSTMIAAGFYSSFAIIEGKLYGWGRNSNGELGLGGKSPSVIKPTRVGYADDWKEIAVGDTHALAVNEYGELYSWGSNDYGQLGQGDSGFNTYRDTPTQIGTATNWLRVAAGEYHSLAIKTNGELYAWGRGNDGQLGLTDWLDANEPKRVGGSNNWVAVAAGFHFSLAVNAAGELWSWGRNNYGELGIESNVNKNEPVRVGTKNDWIKIDAGYSHSLAINSGGELYSWGRNGQGQLGLKDNNNRDKPILVGDNWKTVTGGSYHTLAVTDDDKLYSWGSNNHSQLGFGDTTNRNEPSRVGVESNWVKAAAGYNHSLAMNSLAELHAWGNNDHSQLGTGGSDPTLVVFNRASAIIYAEIPTSAGVGCGISNGSISNSAFITFDAKLEESTTITFNAGVGYEIVKASANLKIGGTEIGDEIFASYSIMMSATDEGWQEIAGVCKYRAWYVGDSQIVSLELDDINHESFSVNSLDIVATTSLTVYNINYGNLQGTTEPAKVTYTVADLPLTLSAPTGTYTGYTFTDWLWGGNPTAMIIPAGTAGDINLSAAWDINKYTVTFDSDGGSSVSPETNVQHGSTINPPSPPTKTGYTFDAWYYEGVVWDFTQDIITDSITLTAEWIAITYQVAFNGNDNTGGSMPNQTHTYDQSKDLAENGFVREYTVTFNYGGAPDGALSGTAYYQFKYWTETSADSGTTYDDEDSVMNLRATSGTFNLYAQWMLGTITLPTPAWEGRIFNGWYTTGGTFIGMGGDTWTPAADVTLVAVWDLEVYTVSFNTDGGSTIQSEDIAHGYKIAKPADPTKTGFVVEGWYRENTFATKWDFTVDEVLGVMTLYVKWEVAKYTITVDTQGGSSIASYTDVIHGTKITQPAEDPKLAGYDFKGWYRVSNPVFGTTPQYNFDSPVTEEFTLYAGWEITKSTLKFVFNNSQANHAINDIPYGTPITSVTPEDWEDFIFVNWYTDNGMTSGIWGSIFVFVTMPDKNVTVYARWKPDPAKLIAQIAQAETVQSKYYVADTYQDVRTSITAATIVLANPNPGMSDYKDAIDDIKKAMDDLLFDTKVLTDIMSTFVDSRKYTAKSYKEWLDACAEAQKYIDKGQSFYTLTGLQQQEGYLNDALSGLVREYLDKADFKNERRKIIESIPGDARDYTTESWDDFRHADDRLLAMLNNIEFEDVDAIERALNELRIARDGLKLSKKGGGNSIQGFDDPLLIGAIIAVALVMIGALIIVLIARRVKKEA